MLADIEILPNCYRLKRFAFLYNPASQGGRSQVQLAHLRQHIDSFESAYLFASQKIGDLGQFVGDHFDDYDIFVACGGDGTVREVASKLINTSKKMGIIPMGTGNDLCKTLHVPKQLEQSIALLKKGQSSAIDVGKCNDFIFLNSLGFGFDGLTNRYASKLKHLHPFLTYAISAFKALFTHHEFEYSILNEGNNKDQGENAIMLTLANGRVEGGSFWVAPEASICDGMLDFIVVKPVSRWLIPVLLPLILIKKPKRIPQLTSRQLKKLKIRFGRPVDIHADGEVIDTDCDQFDISISKEALEVICGL